MDVLDDPPRTAVRRNGWTHVNQHVQRLDTLPPLAQTDGNTDDGDATHNSDPTTNNNPEGATGLRTSILEASERLKLPPGSRRKKRKPPLEPSDHPPKRPRVGETQGQATQDLASEQEDSLVKEVQVPFPLASVRSHRLFAETPSRLDAINAVGTHPVVHPTSHQPVHQSIHQTVHHQTVHQQPVHHQTVHHQTVHQQPVHQQPVHHQPVHQQPVHQQPVHQQPVHQQPVHQQPVHQQPTYRQPVHQQPIYQQPVHQQPIHRPTHRPLDLLPPKEIDVPRDPSVAQEPVKVVVTDWGRYNKPPPTWREHIDQVPGMIKDSSIEQLEHQKKLPLDPPFRDSFFAPRFSFTPRFSFAPSFSLAPEVGIEDINKLTPPALPSTNVSLSHFRRPYQDTSDADARSEFLVAGASLVEKFTSRPTWDGAKDLALLAMQRFLKITAKHQGTVESDKMLAADEGCGKFPFLAYLRTRHCIPTCFRIPLPTTILVSDDERAGVIFEIFGIVREPQGYWDPASPPAFVEIADLFFPQYPESLKVIPNPGCRVESNLDTTTLRKMAKCDLLSSREHQNKRIIRAIVRAIPAAVYHQTDNKKDPRRSLPPHKVGRYDMVAYQTFPIPSREGVPFTRFLVGSDIWKRAGDWAFPSE
ncbi:hypothetical protein B0A52_05858 [Exophiala mesophila]|uniref:Uncharacterized protein n=1 Tax=Exophiala mesophila TaxID=212818 RepID=A0A438N3N6_EXOME|nr:hypothetical protein B0A52_05858 [Exophiala mesophila]